MCTWYLLVPSANVYVSIPVVTAMLQHVNASEPTVLNLILDSGPTKSNVALQVVSAALMTSCSSHATDIALRQCLAGATPCHLHEVATSDLFTTLVEANVWNAL